MNLCPLTLKYLGSMLQYFGTSMNDMEMDQ